MLAEEIDRRFSCLVEEAASILCKSPITIRNWIKAGKLAAKKLGGKNQNHFIIERRTLEKLL